MLHCTFSNFWKNIDFAFIFSLGVFQTLNDQETTRTTGFWKKNFMTPVKHKNFASLQRVINDILSGIARACLFFLFFSSMLLSSYMLSISVVLPLLSGFFVQIWCFTSRIAKNASFEHRYWRLTKIHIGQKLKQIVLCGWKIC